MERHSPATGKTSFRRKTRGTSSTSVHTREEPLQEKNE